MIEKVSAQARGAAAVLHSAAGSRNADVPLCLVRLMYVPSEETTVHRAPSLRVHRHLIFLHLGTCLLNPASGKRPALHMHTVHKCMLKAHGTIIT